MDDQPDTGADAPLPTTIATAVPDHIIPVELPHPTTIGGMLARGAKYAHHFEVELVSDGRRLWAAASAEGRAIIAAIKGEIQAEQDKLEAHKAALAAGAAPSASGAVTDPANPGNAPGGA